MNNKAIEVENQSMQKFENLKYLIKKFKLNKYNDLVHNN